MLPCFAVCSVVYVSLFFVDHSWSHYALWFGLFRFQVTVDAVASVVCENYRRCIRLREPSREQHIEPFSHVIWNSLRLHQAEYTVQAWFLEKALRRRVNKFGLSESSWSDLMGMLPSEAASVTRAPEDCNRISSASLHSIDSSKFWSDCSGTSTANHLRWFCRSSFTQPIFPRFFVDSLISWLR